MTYLPSRRQQSNGSEASLTDWNPNTGRMRLRRVLTTIAIAVAGLFVALTLLLYFGQSKLLFIPSRTIDATPDEAGLTYRDVYIPVAQEGSPPPAGTVLFCHGNAGNISHRLPTVQFLLRRGVNVLLFDYRGYGRSDGASSEQNAYADALAAYHWLVRRQGVSPDELFLFGRSLGGAVAVDLAGRVECAGVILESSFTSVAEMGRRLYPFLPIRLLVRYRFDSVSKIGRLTCPVLVAHSPDDDMIPFDMGRELFAAAAADKEFLELSGGHNDLDCLQNEKYIKGLESFFGNRPGAGTPPDGAADSTLGQIR